MVLGEFSVENVNAVLDDEVKNSLELVMSFTKCDEVCDITSEMLMKLSKKDLVSCVEQLTDAVWRCEYLLKGATIQVDVLKDEHISFQKKIIEQQDNILKCRTEQVNSVQATVRTELQSYSNAVMKSCSPNSDNMITTEQLKKAVKCAVEEEDRSRNLIIYGLKEQDEENLEEKVLEF